MTVGRKDNSDPLLLLGYWPIVGPPPAPETMAANMRWKQPRGPAGKFKAEVIAACLHWFGAGSSKLLAYDVISAEEAAQQMAQEYGVGAGSGDDDDDDDSDESDESN